VSEIRQTKGLAELNLFFDQFPAEFKANVLPGALRAAAQPIKDAAVSMCPVGKPSDEGRRLYGLHEGSLRDSIRISMRSDGGVITASVTAGGKTQGNGDVWYAHLIEFTGAIAHTIRSRIGKQLKFGGLFRRSVNHPGMYARPFLRPALDSQAAAAVIAAAEYSEQNLDKKIAA